MLFFANFSLVNNLILHNRIDLFWNIFWKIHSKYSEENIFIENDWKHGISNNQRWRRKCRRKCLLFWATITNRRSFTLLTQTIIKLNGIGFFKVSLATNENYQHRTYYFLLYGMFKLLKSASIFYLIVQRFSYYFDFESCLQVIRVNYSIKMKKKKIVYHVC